MQSYGEGTGLAQYYAGTIDGKSKPKSNTDKGKKAKKYLTDYGKMDKDRVRRKTCITTAAASRG